MAAVSAGAMAASAWTTAATPGAEAQAPVTCNGRTATIVGTAGNDTISGTSGPDVIAALGGNDVVRGLGDNHTISLGAGRDSAKGGAGDDRFVAEPSDGTTPMSATAVGTRCRTSPAPSP